MSNCFYLLPLWNALIVWVILTLLIKFLFKYLLPGKKEAISQGLIQFIDNELTRSGNPLIENIQQLNLESEIDPILDKRLDLLVDHFKSQIPMGEFILSSSLTEKLKQKVKIEILKTMPEVKEAFIKKIKTEFDLKVLIEQKIRSYHFKQFTQSFYQQAKPELLKLKGLGACLGFMFGFIELIIFLMLC